jgi:hypothetical protein
MTCSTKCTPCVEHMSATQLDRLAYSDRRIANRMGAELFTEVDTKIRAACAKLETEVEEVAVAAARNDGWDGEERRN